MVKRTYKQFCPTARALDVVGDRWTLLIVRNLLIAPRRYTDLRAGLPGMASNLLAQRLGEMEDAGLIEKRQIEEPSSRTVYVLTERGRELRGVVRELARFGFPYLDAPTDDQPMEAERVPLGLVALLHPAELPDGALRIRCALDEGDHTITIAPPGPPGERRTLDERIEVASVAATGAADNDGEPPADVPPADVTIRGSIAALLWVAQGEMTGAEAEAQGLLRLDGPADAVAAARRAYRL